jgi:hypothetical protein
MAAIIVIITLATTVFSIPKTQATYPFTKEERVLVDSLLKVLVVTQDLKYMLYQCGEEVSVGHNPSSSTLNECLAVANDWNTHLDQLYEKHALIIDKYASAFSDNCLNDPTYAETFPKDCANVLNATTPS